MLQAEKAHTSELIFDALAAFNAVQQTLEQAAEHLLCEGPQSTAEVEHMAYEEHMVCEELSPTAPSTIYQVVTAAHVAAASQTPAPTIGSAFTGPRVLAPPLPEHTHQLGFVAVGSGALASLSKCAEYGLGHVVLSIELLLSRVEVQQKSYAATDSNIACDDARNLQLWFDLGLRGHVRGGHVSLLCVNNSPANIHYGTPEATRRLKEDPTCHTIGVMADNELDLIMVENPPGCLKGAKKGTRKGKATPAQLEKKPSSARRWLQAAQRPKGKPQYIAETWVLDATLCGSWYTRDTVIFFLFLNSGEGLKALSRWVWPSVSMR